MNPAVTYAEVRARLGYSLEQSDRSALLVGLLFCRPSAAAARDELLPAVLDFHYRSGPATHFYFAGFKQIGIPNREAVTPRSETGAPSMEYDAKAFTEFTQLIELKTVWKYSGGTDLILANGRYNGKGREGYVDFSSAVAITLEVMRAQGAYHELGMLFESIFRIATEHQGDDPVSAVSDAFGKGILVGLAKDAAFKAVPFISQNKVESGLGFACRDLRSK